MSANPLELAPEAHEEMRGAAEQFQRAANVLSKGYRLLYLTVPGCGSIHNYNHLRNVQAMGIPVQYMNVFFPGQVFSERNPKTNTMETAPGKSLPAANINAALDYIASKGLDVSELPHAVLLRPDGSVVREFKSTQNSNVLKDLQAVIACDSTPACRGKRGAVRS